MPSYIGPIHVPNVELCLLPTTPTSFRPEVGGSTANHDVGDSSAPPEDEHDRDEENVDEEAHGGKLH